MKTGQSKSATPALLGMFAAIVVVLQLLSYTVKIGNFSLSLVLIPIVLSGIMFGSGFGAIIGGVFGLVTFIASAAGMDQGGNILFAASPWLTAIICLVKGSAAGAAAGLFKPLSEKKPTAAVILAAVAVPVVNTGLFILGMSAFFGDILTEWAGGAPIVSYIIVGLTGINFLIELVINMVMSPVIMRLIPSIKRLF